MPRSRLLFGALALVVPLVMGCPGEGEVAPAGRCEALGRLQARVGRTVFNPMPGGDTAVARWPMPDSMTARCVADSEEVDCASFPGTAWDGQDGQRTSPQPSFAPASAGRVTDTVTGLTWDAQTTTGSWDAAACGCRASTVGAYNDWRLPSVVEMVSLLDTGTHGFQGISSAWAPGDRTQFWTRDAYAAEVQRAWTLTLEGPETQDRREVVGFVYFCVRGGSDTTGIRYETTTGVATDLYTGLKWERHPADATLSWSLALARCANLELEGRTSWRLPSVKELLTLVDRSRSSPAVDPVTFTGASLRVRGHWTSTPSAGTRGESVSVDLDTGAVSAFTDVRGAGGVICVSD